MYCPRLDHFVRFNNTGTIGKCGHMTTAPEFTNWESMQKSSWLADIKKQMDNNQWPSECQRCQTTEHSNDPHSIRLNSIKRDTILSKIKTDYLILGGVLDNICNSACQSCNANLSTKIGSLETKDYIKINNVSLFNKLPMEQVVELDLNGGEPTASPAYQQLLTDLPVNVKIIRVNTNGSRLLPNINKILDRKIKLIITLSLDGVENVHDYVRWPITWSNYTKTVNAYTKLKQQHANLTLEAWTTVHSLNVGNFDQIEDYARSVGLNHSWAFLNTPKALNPIYTNTFTLDAKNKLLNNSVTSKIAINKNNQDQLDSFIDTQDRLRNIKIKDYI